MVRVKSAGPGLDASLHHSYITWSGARLAYCSGDTLEFTYLAIGLFGY